MDEEIAIINANTRSEKIKNFFIKNKKNLILIISIIILVIIGYFANDEFKKKKKIKLANQYHSTIINYNTGEKIKTINKLTNLVNKKDKTYSPLALYFLIDNNLIENREEVNNLFNILIDKTKLEPEIKNLIIYKKALYNSDFLSENELNEILRPIINSKSIWKSHALYLIAEYYYSNNEKLKAKEFFNEIISLINSNKNIKSESIKRLNRDFSE